MQCPAAHTDKSKLAVLQQDQVSLVCIKYCFKKPCRKRASVQFLLSLDVFVLQAVEHPSTTQSTSSVIPPHQLCPTVRTSALSFPHPDLNLQYLLEGFHLPSFVLCVWFGDSFSSLYTCCFSCFFAIFMFCHLYDLPDQYVNPMHSDSSADF